jgi:hypothetical protein
MATYSTNLALTLLATGEGAGTWGDTTNTNLGTLLEQSISGYVTESLTTGTTLTLTIPNGATGVARNMYLEFTGNGSTVIVPSNKKLYFVYNNCSSGSITFKVAGQTGVTIDKGSKQILVSNGTDITTAVTSLNGITTTAVTALGTNAGDSSTNGGLVAVGYNAGTAVTSGYGNTAVGHNSLKLATNGEYNVAVGIEAGDAISSGSYNTCVGTSAGGNVTSGGANTFVGTSAGNGVSSGNNNTAVGDSAYTSSSGNYSNSTCLGQGTAVTGSNQVQLGNSSTTTYAYGAVQDRSDLRDKADIRDTQLGLDFVMALRPRDYKWDMRDDYKPPKPAQDAPESEWAAWREACKLANLTHDGTHTRTRYHHGLIAQEVKQTMDTLGVDFGGYQDHTIKGGDAVLTIGYEELVAPLIKAIQELKAEFDAYKSTHP